MKKVIISIITTMLLLTGANALENGVFTIIVEAGEEGVVTKKPLIFGSGGVEQIPLKTNRYWKMPTTTAVGVNIRPTIKTETFDDLVTSDRNYIDFHAFITFKAIEGKTPILFEKFGGNWYNTNVKNPTREIIRKYTESKTLEYMMIHSNKKGAENISTYVKNKVEELLLELKIPVKVLKVSIDKAIPQDAVKKSMQQTAIMQQEEKTQIAMAKKEKARSRTEIERAIADKKYMETMGFSKEQFLETQKILNIRKAVELGKANFTVISGTNAQPVIPLGEKSAK